MRHLKRQMTPKEWPIKRKGTKYVIRSLFNLKNGVPVLIILRDMLGFAANRREVKKAIVKKNLLLNNKLVRDDRIAMVLFDVLTIKDANKNYQMQLEKNGKFKVVEIASKDSGKKVSKVVNKKILKGKKIQLNLSDGRNFLSDIKCNVNDSVLIDLEKKKIEKCLPMKEKSEVLIISGKHSGKEGILDKIKKERKMAKIKTDDGEISVLIKQIMVVK